MSKDVSKLDPDRFGLSSFADLIAPRDPLIGEVPGVFEAFREGLFQSLLPMTPYEDRKSVV